MHAHKPELDTREDSGVLCYTPSPPPKKSLPRSYHGTSQSHHKALQHRRPSQGSIHASGSPEDSHQEVIIPPKLDLSGLIGDDSESDVSSSVATSNRTSLSLDEPHPELAMDTPSTDSRVSWGRIPLGYGSDLGSSSSSSAPSSCSSPGSIMHHKLTRYDSGELEDESEGSVLKVKLKLKSARPRSGSGVRANFSATKARESPPLGSSSDVLGNKQIHEQRSNNVIRSKYAPLPGIGIQGMDQNANREHRKPDDEYSPNDQLVKTSPALHSNLVSDEEIREQRLKALERSRSASQAEIRHKVPVPPPQSAKTVSRRAMRMQQFARRKSAGQAETALRQSIRAGSEARDSGKSVLLAIRLPSGSRVQNLFDSSQSLKDVVQYALKEGKCSLAASSVCLVTNDMPKRELKDLFQTIDDAGLSDRTLLHLEELD